MDWNNFSDESRLWIYNSETPFSESDSLLVQQYIDEFCEAWTSHNIDLKARGELKHNQFVILMVDESMAGASGCSIDKSVAFIKYLEEKFDKNLTNRMIFSVLDGNEVLNFNKDEFKKAFAESKISEQSLVFDNLVKNKKDFESAWLKPISESWHKKFV